MTAMQYTAESTVAVINWLPRDKYRVTDMCGKPVLEVQTAKGFERAWLGDWIVADADGVLSRYTSEEYCPHSKRVDGPTHTWRFDGDDPYIICVFCDEMRDALSARVVRDGRGVA